MKAMRVLLHVSWTLLFFAALLYVLLLIFLCLYFTGMVLFWAWVMTLLSALWFAWLHSSLNQNKIRVIQINPTGSVRILLGKDTKPQWAVLTQGSYESVLMLLLVFRTANGIKKVMVLPDMVNHEEYRQLTVWMKWHRHSE